VIRTYAAAGVDIAAAADVSPRPFFNHFPTKEAAYFARDEEIIRSADRVIALWDGSSSGTAYELDFARQIGKPVELVNAFEPNAGGVETRRRTTFAVKVVRRASREPEPPDRDPGGDAA